MIVTSTREFRANQGKFLTAARKGQSVLLKSRYGNFKIVPVAADDKIVAEGLREAMGEVKAHLQGEIELPLAKDLTF